MQNNPYRNQDSQRLEQGFSLLEAVVATMILTVGLLGVATAIGYSLMASNSGRGITNAKLLVVSALEQMETLRNTNQLNFDEISNSQVSGSSFSGFPDTFLAVSTVPGSDGIFGTSDDITDQSQVVKGATRQILISSLSPTLKRIQVTLRYSPNGGAVRELVGVSYLNDDRHGNYVP
jgi:type II secretory pathway pseudopilin PulG